MGEDKCQNGAGNTRLNSGMKQRKHSCGRPSGGLSARGSGPVGDPAAGVSVANARLVVRVAALERNAGRDSGNSSMPPSTDDLPGRKKPPPRQVRGSGRTRGKQRGAPGSSLPWVAVPDEHVAHRPEGECSCGADLAEAAEVGIERSHQTHDLPEIRIVVRQHDVYRVRCGCGREHVAALPDTVSAAPSARTPANSGPGGRAARSPGIS